MLEDGVYSAFPLGRLFPVVILTLLALADVVSLVGGGSPWLFNLLFTLVLVYMGYWALWLLVSELSLSDETITWRTSLRSGEVRTIDIRRIRPGRGLAQSMEIIEMDKGDRLCVFGGPDFERFCDLLQTVRSDLPVQLSAQTRLMMSIFKSPRQPPPS